MSKQTRAQLRTRLVIRSELLYLPSFTFPIQKMETVAPACWRYPADRRHREHEVLRMAPGVHIGKD